MRKEGRVCKVEREREREREKDRGKKEKETDNWRRRYEKEL